MMIFISGIIGISMVITFLAVMVVWVPAPPLIIIVVSVMALLIWDFIQTLRYGENGRRK